ncbi:hypothetical protein QTI66_06155 [Variovorax sp. J22R133]|uniref:hypothetical protein n=1 Tax=Variovorax brevis TaxID=3053503 RepID=UPI00257624AC|nr:hypothetical protein [Variovorax sp. J22R133]MDM0111724.1 hypothetical protein [Variovorax sp. J22R133]
MGILLAFAPFIAFALLQRTLGVLPALAVAALISLVFTARDAFTPGRHAKILEIGSTILFGGLAVGAWATHAEWPILQVRLWVDAGLLFIVLISLVVRRPFTLGYAREQVPQEYWSSPRFVRTNDIITSAWALAFAVMVAADVLMLYLPSVPLWIGVTATVAALAGAIRFTQWYSQKAGAAAAQGA